MYKCLACFLKLAVYHLYTPIFSFTGSPTGVGALNLTAVLSGVAVSFLLLALLVAGISGLVLLRRAKRKEGLPKKRLPSVKSMECTEKVEEPQGKVEEATTGNECEHCIDNVRVEQYVEELNHESANILIQRSLDSVEGNRIRCNGDYDEIDAAEILSRDWDRHGTVDEGLHVDQPTDTRPDAVYAVVDKSRKKKKGKTEGDQSTTATQDHYTEEQHYESSTVIGMDWLGTVVKTEGNAGGVEMGSLSDDPKVTGLQSESCEPNAVYAVVDKSKKRKKEN